MDPLLHGWKIQEDGVVLCPNCREELDKVVEEFMKKEDEVNTHA
jgi:uncharacterized Zn finger protein (UPF0148 family)